VSLLGSGEKKSREQRKKMFSELKTVLLNLRYLKCSNPPPLGRWASDCRVSSEIKSALANLDCCGDKLCGDPVKASEAITVERTMNSDY